MDLSEFSRKYFYLFYICGQSAFNPREQICSQRRKLNFKRKFTLPMILSTLFMVTITVSGIITQNGIDAKDMNLVNFFFGNIFLLGLCTTCYCIIFQNSMHQKNLKIIFHKFTVIEQIFWAHLHQRLSFSDFSRQFRRKLFVCISLFLLAFVAMIFINLYYGNQIRVTMHIFVLMFFTITAQLHALLYIDLEHYLIKSFVKNVQMEGRARIARVLYGKPEDTATISARLGYYKHVHFKLWDISQAIGMHFGWILLCICMQNFIDIAYSTYWIYRSVRGNIQMTIMRKYTFN